MPTRDSDLEYSGEYGYLKILQKFYRSYIRERKFKYFTIQFLHIIGALLGLVPPLILRTVVDDAIPEGNMSYIVNLVLLALGVYLVSNILRFIRVYFGHKYAQYITRDMRNDLFEKYQDLSMNFHDEKKTGELMSRVIDDLNRLQEFVHHGPEAIIASGVMVLGTAVILFTMSVRLAVVSMLFAPLLMFFGYFIMTKMHKAFRKTRENKAEMSDKLEDSLAGIKVTKAFNNKEHEMGSFSEKNQQHADTRMWAVKYMSFLFSGSRILNSFGLLAVISYGAYLTSIEIITVGTLFAFYTYLERFRGPLLRLVQTGEGVSRFFASTERFFKHIEKSPQILENSGSESAADIKGEVEFIDVDFSYDEEQILDNINFIAEENKTVALVGPSGAGKTTIVRLIPRLYDVNKGQLLIDNKDVKDYKVEELRKSIAMVMQEDFLFSTSVAENIAYGKPDATMEEIKESAKKANAHQFITEELSDGYDTQVGQRGVKLSGGQRQRVSIARAFLKDPTILILDEATSSVDLETEELIQEAVNEVSHGRTTFIIAHRLATIINADEILFIEDGKIKEKGNHQELINKDTNYKNFYSKQFRTA